MPRLPQTAADYSATEHANNPISAFKTLTPRSFHTEKITGFSPKKYAGEILSEIFPKKSRKYPPASWKILQNRVVRIQVHDRECPFTTQALSPSTVGGSGKRSYRPPDGHIPPATCWGSCTKLSPVHTIPYYPHWVKPSHLRHKKKSVTSPRRRHTILYFAHTILGNDKKQGIRGFNVPG